MAFVKKIVTVQDISCYGQCSITAAQPVLSALGIETAILPSAILSTHTGGFRNFTVLDLTDEMPKIVNHWKEEGITFDAVYTGYIGDARQFDIIKDMRALLNEGGLMIVDPAMADHGVLYPALSADIVEGMKRLVAEADVIMPNLTEASFLLDREYQENYSKEDIVDMLKALGKMGPRYSIITGVSFEEGQIGAACYDKETGEIFTYFTELVGKSFHGTGDIFSAVAVAKLVKGESVEKAIQDACDFTVKSIKATLDDKDHFYGVHFEAVLAGEDQ